MDIFNLASRKIERYCLMEWKAAAENFIACDYQKAGDISKRVLTRFPQHIDTNSFNFTQSVSDIKDRDWLPLCSHFIFMLACQHYIEGNKEHYIELLMKLTKEKETPLRNKWYEENVENRRRNGKAFFKEIHLPSANKVYQSGLIDAFLLSLRILSESKITGIDVAHRYYFCEPDGYDIQRAWNGGWHMPDNPVSMKFKIDWLTQKITVGSDVEAFDFLNIKRNYEEVLTRLKGLSAKRINEYYWSSNKEFLIRRLMRQNNTWL